MQSTFVHDRRALPVHPSHKQEMHQDHEEGAQEGREKGDEGHQKGLEGHEEDGEVLIVQT